MSSQAARGSRFVHVSAPLAIAVGDAIPGSVPVQDGAPGESRPLSELIGTGKHILTGVPAAFSPTCSETHIPGYIAQADALKAKGVEDIFVLSVNDAFVMQQWGKALGADGKVKMVADVDGAATAAMNTGFVAEAPFGKAPRSTRYALLVEDGKVTQALLEGGPGFEKCSADEMLKLL